MSPEAKTTFAQVSALVLLLAGSCSYVHGGAQVYMKTIELYTTHDWFFETPEVYFQCEGEPKRFITGVTKAHVQYNFSLLESFQPVTELDVPRCKRCGLFEMDLFTEDDVFDRFELCPLDFSEPPEGKLLWDAPREMNVTFFCKDCNTANVYAGGVIISSPMSTTTNYLIIFFAVLACALLVSLLVAGLAFLGKEGRLSWLDRRAADDAKFMEMFDDEDDDFLNGDDIDVELAQQHGSTKDD